MRSDFIVHDDGFGQDTAIAEDIVLVEDGPEGSTHALRLSVADGETDTSRIFGRMIPASNVATEAYVRFAHADCTAHLAVRLLGDDGYFAAIFTTGASVHRASASQLGSAASSPAALDEWHRYRLYVRDETDGTRVCLQRWVGDDWVDLVNVVDGGDPPPVVGEAAFGFTLTSADPNGPVIWFDEWRCYASPQPEDA
jgi:hypothetical protein